MTDSSKTCLPDSVINQYIDIGRRLEFSRKWARKWEKKSTKIHDEAKDAIKGGDLKTAKSKLSQLEELNKRRHVALQNMFCTILEPNSE